MGGQAHLHGEYDALLYANIKHLSACKGLLRRIISDTNIYASQMCADKQCFSGIASHMSHHIITHKQTDTLLLSLQLPANITKSEHTSNQTLSSCPSSCQQTCASHTLDYTMPWTVLGTQEQTWEKHRHHQQSQHDDQWQHPKSTRQTEPNNVLLP